MVSPGGPTRSRNFNDLHLQTFLLVRFEPKSIFRTLTKASSLHSVFLMRHDAIPATVAAKASPAGGIGPNGPACFEQGGRHCWCIIGNPESLAHEVDIAGFDFQSEQRC